MKITSTEELRRRMASQAESPSSARGTGGVVVERVTKRFHTSSGTTVALSDVSLVVERGQFVTLIGPSGCGKSTLLRILAGLEGADTGQVSIFGESVERACERKHIGFVPQSPALLPWRSVLENVRVPLEVNKRAGGAERVGELPDPKAILAAFGLSAVLDKRPAQLSGGMQQRVAIARAFAFRPAVLLMDEPFSALDELTREVLRHELLDLWQQLRTTVVFVTHSVPEAVLLSDAVVVMSAGPGRIGATIPVHIARPRGELVELSDEFRDVERAVRVQLREGWRHGAA
jgi:NitT/TauT family transport system ATP-binding protein